MLNREVCISFNGKSSEEIFVFDFLHGSYVTESCISNDLESIDVNQQISPLLMAEAEKLWNHFLCYKSSWQQESQLQQQRGFVSTLLCGSAVQWRASHAGLLTGKHTGIVPKQDLTLAPGTPPHAPHPVVHWQTSFRSLLQCHLL